jgi:hypothetical protein
MAGAGFNGTLGRIFGEGLAENALVGERPRRNVGRSENVVGK